MSDFKREYEATHVSITLPDGVWSCEEEETHCAQGWEGAFQIVLDTGRFIWVQVSYAHGEPKGVETVKQASSTARRDWHDCQGNLILAIPASWCKFLSPQEADELEMALSVDDAMGLHCGRNG